MLEDIDLLLDTNHTIVIFVAKLVSYFKCQYLGTLCVLKVNTHGSFP